MRATTNGNGSGPVVNPGSGPSRRTVVTSPVCCVPVRPRSRPRRSPRARACQFTTCELLQQILAAIKSTQAGTVTVNAPDYVEHVTRLRRLKILRDMYYPDWQADWG